MTINLQTLDKLDTFLEKRMIKMDIIGKISIVLILQNIPNHRLMPFLQRSSSPEQLH